MHDRDEALLNDILEHGSLALGLVRGVPLERFRKDVGIRYGTERLLEIVGEAMGNLSDDVRNMMPVDARKVRGLRNILAHRYAVVDPATVHAAATIELPRLLAGVRALLDDP